MAYRHLVAKSGLQATESQLVKSFASVAQQEGEWKVEKRSEKWEQVQKKRYRNRFTGNKGKAVVQPENNFRAADISTPIYIYNVSKQTTKEDILKYIKNKTSIDVNLIKWNMKHDKAYCAFKIFVPQHKLETFLCDDFWPEGISFRRFISFRRNKGGPEEKGILQRALNEKTNKNH